MTHLVHPYIPNSEPATRAQMLAAIGVQHVDQLYASIPAELRAPAEVEFPPALAAEADLERYFVDRLGDHSAGLPLCFLGGGCWPHFVPAICDEIANRREFLTGMIGFSPQSTPGAYQALFEYQSMLCELLDMDSTGVPTYDWGSAAVSALRIAVRATGRTRVLVAGNISPERREQIEHLERGHIAVDVLPFELDTGLVGIKAIASALADDVAAVYVEQPNFFGGLDVAVTGLAEVVHGRGALLVVGVDPISLGVVEAPGRYGADLVCGDLQPLGLHMQFGAGMAGFLACREEFADSLPMLHAAAYPGGDDGITPAFFVGGLETSSYALRAESVDFTGTTQLLWGVVAGAYLAAMGPAGMREVGEGVLARRAYAIEALGAIDGVRADRFGGPGFKEFVVDLTATGRGVAEVNKALWERGILGGHPLDGLPGCALYCVTEIHSREDIDRLARTLQEVLA